MRGPQRVSLWLGSAIASVLAAVAGCERPTTKPAVKPPVVMVSAPITEEVQDYEDFTGRTDAIPKVEIRARVTGYLEKVYFKDGDDVKEGDLMFVIDPRLYKADLERATSTVSQNEARFNRLDLDYNRAKKLFERGVIGREEYDKSFGDRAEAEAALGVSKAALDYAKLNDEFTRVRAPISGRVSRRMVDPGNLVQADVTALTNIVSLDPLYVYWDIDERTLLKIRRLIREGKVKTRSEQEVPVFAALSDEEDFPHRGTIDFADNQLDASTGTLRLRAQLENPKPHLLSPGLFMRIRLPVGPARRSIMIPEQALGTDQGRKFLYVVNPKTKEVIKRSVVIGKLDKGLREIHQGLAQGESVVVSGLQRIRDGLKVEPRPAETVGGSDRTKAQVASTGPVTPTPTPTKDQALSH
jgi:multidrug efflux system membrane fusion protein